MHIYQNKSLPYNWRIKDVRPSALPNSENQSWEHESQQKLHLQNKPFAEIQGICCKKKTFPSVVQGKTTAGIILAALCTMIKCHNDIVPLPIAEQKETRFKPRERFGGLFVCVCGLFGWFFFAGWGFFMCFVIVAGGGGLGFGWLVWGFGVWRGLLVCWFGLVSDVVNLKRCGRETLRKNKAREIIAEKLTFLLFQSQQLMGPGQDPHNKVKQSKV